MSFKVQNPAASKQQADVLGGYTLLVLLKDGNFFSSLFLFSRVRLDVVSVEAKPIRLAEHGRCCDRGKEVAALSFLSTAPGHRKG